MRVLIVVLEIVLICVASSALINYAVSRPPSRQDVQAVKFSAANNARFKALLDAGAKQMRSAQYTDALASFQAAEQTTDELSEGQYESLKASWLQIATVCETSGRSSDAESAYKALVESGIREGEILLRASQFNGALARLQDAEKFSEHLTETQEASLLEARSDMVVCLRQMHRIPDAVEVSQRMIDFLRMSGDEYDPALTAKYLEISESYSQENDWYAAEPNLQLASGLCDRRIAHLSGLDGAEAPMNAALMDKDLTLYWLITTYEQEGRTDFALGAAEDMFSFVAQHSKPWADLGPYSRKEVAKLALQIATQANRKDAIDLWTRRLQSLK
jgi:hypothetical protein